MAGKCAGSIDAPVHAADPISYHDGLRGHERACSRRRITASVMPFVLGSMTCLEASSPNHASVSLLPMEKGLVHLKSGKAWRIFELSQMRLHALSPFWFATYPGSLIVIMWEGAWRD